MEIRYLGPELPKYSIEYLRSLPANEFWGMAGMTKRQMERTLFLFDAYQLRPCVDLSWLNKTIGSTDKRAYDGHYRKPAFFRLKAGYPFSVLAVQDSELTKFEATEYPVGNNVQASVYDLFNRYALDVWPMGDEFKTLYVFVVWDEKLLEAQHPAYIKVPGGRYYSFNDDMYAPPIYSLDVGPLRRSVALKDLEKAVKEENQRRIEHPEEFAASYRGDDAAEDAYWKKIDEVSAKERKEHEEELRNPKRGVRSREEKKELRKKIKEENRRLKKLDKLRSKERNLWT